MAGQSSAAGLPRIPRERPNDFKAEIVNRRRALCEGVAKAELLHLGGVPVPLESAQGNVENLIGYAQVPVGIAGPLVLDGETGRREVYVPFATNEGALVASYSRGMRLLNAGGVTRARVVAEGLSQHPMLTYQDLAAASAARNVALRETERYKVLAQEHTSHGSLLRVEPELLGRRLILRLVFETGDAIGINMAAEATERISADLASMTSALERFVHGQDVEKRANARAQQEGRGRSVIAEGVVPRDVLLEAARTTPEQMVRIARSYAVGFAQLGTQNWLVQAANGLAGVMLACGQDMAYLTESATGQLDIDLTSEGDLYGSVSMPSLILGTVGGGSQKGTALECLELLGCSGDGGARPFAEILGATILAGDISLLAAFCYHEFIAAHEQLGRNRPTGSSAV
jgi:hydroxymethylglutaryl-CoA reductase (NADPH)